MATKKYWTTRAVAALTACVSLLGGCSLKQPEGEIQGLAGMAIAADRALAGMHYKVLQIDGFKIPYLEGGQGEPLVLIHGFGGSKDNFNRVAKVLTAHYTVYAIDLPGFGGTNREPGADYTIPRQAERVHDIVQRLGLQRPHIGGNSMGGAIAGAYASKYHDEVGSVWFLAPAGMRASEKSEVREHFNKTGELLLIATDKSGYERLLDLVMTKKPAFAPGFVLEAMAERSKADAALHMKIFRGLRAQPTFLPELYAQQPYAGPALIVWGKQDRVLHVDGAAELKSALPQAKVVLMDDTGHVPQMERPEEVAAEYIRWRNSLVTATAAASH